MTVNDGFVKLQRDGQEINLNPAYGGAGGNAVIESNDPVSLVSNSKYGLTVATNGVVDVPTGLSLQNLPEADNNPAHTPNLWIHPSSNRIYKTLYTPTRMEDVEKAIDKNNAIKDKLIEKLSARLDELEKKVK